MPGRSFNLRHNFRAFHRLQVLLVLVVAVVAMVVAIVAIVAAIGIKGRTPESFSQCSGCCSCSGCSLVRIKDPTTSCGPDVAFEYDDVIRRARVSGKREQQATALRAHF